MSSLFSHLLSISEILDIIKKLEKISKDTELASIFGVRQSLITMWRKRGTVPYENLLHYCELRNIDPLWLLTGKGPKYRSESSKTATTRHPKLNLMKEVIEAVEEVFERDKLSLSPEKKARLITLIYEEVSEDEKKLPLIGQKVGKLIKLAS
jgi:hypothetical protein